MTKYDHFCDQFGGSKHSKFLVVLRRHIPDMGGRRRHVEGSKRDPVVAGSNLRTKPTVRPDADAAVPGQTSAAQRHGGGGALRGTVAREVFGRWREEEEGGCSGAYLPSALAAPRV